MAMPPSLRRISLEDLSSLDPEVRKGITKLISMSNPFYASVTSALNKQLTFTENSQCVIKTLRFTMPSIEEPLVITGFGTSIWNSTYGMPMVRRVGNEVKIRGLLKHRATNLVSLSDPIFQLPNIAGYRPITNWIGPVSYLYEPATIEINKDTGKAYMAYANSSSPSGHIDLDVIDYYTNDDLPSFKKPFPLDIDVSSLGKKPIVVLPIKVQDVTNKSPKLAQIPTLAWTTENLNGKNTVRIHRADGLIQDRVYELTVLCTY